MTTIGQKHVATPQVKPKKETKKTNATKETTTEQNKPVDNKPVDNKPEGVNTNDTQGGTAKKSVSFAQLSGYYNIQKTDKTEQNNEAQEPQAQKANTKEPREQRDTLKRDTLKRGPDRRVIIERDTLENITERRYQQLKKTDGGYTWVDEEKKNTTNK